VGSAIKSLKRPIKEKQKRSKKLHFQWQLDSCKGKLSTGAGFVKWFRVGSKSFRERKQSGGIESRGKNTFEKQRIVHLDLGEDKEGKAIKQGKGWLRFDPKDRGKTSERGSVREVCSQPGIPLL